MISHIMRVVHFLFAMFSAYFMYSLCGIQREATDIGMTSVVLNNVLINKVSLHQKLAAGNVMKQC